MWPVEPTFVSGLTISPTPAMVYRFIIPFKFETGRCRQIVKKWLGSSWPTAAAISPLFIAWQFNRSQARYETPGE